MRRLVLLALLFATHVYADPLPPTVTLPAKPTELRAEAYGEVEIKVNDGGDGKDTVVGGKHWSARLDMSFVKNDDENRKKWQVLVDSLKKSGWQLVLSKQDWNPPYASMKLVKNGKESWLAFWATDDTTVEVIEKGGPSTTLKLTAPTDGIAKVGDKDDFPFLKKFPGAKLVSSSHDDAPFLVALEDGKDPVAVASGSVIKRYEMPPATSNLEPIIVYRDALEAAGWTIVELNIAVSTGDPNLTAHYSKGPIDLWAHVHAPDMLQVADAGAERGSAQLKATLDKACKVAIYGVNFDFDKATLRTDATPALDAIYKLLTDYKDLRVELGGHTDNVGDRKYNQTLSEQRVNTVKAWLVKKGVAGDRLTTHGYADTVPVVPNDTPAHQAKNRRVELKKTDCKK
jgi:OOP family OmpA-OmpF porin